MEKEALEQLTTGKSLYGEGGNFTPLLKRFIEKALEAVVGGMDTSISSQGFPWDSLVCFVGFRPVRAAYFALNFF